MNDLVAQDVSESTVYFQEILNLLKVYGVAEYPHTYGRFSL